MRKHFFTGLAVLLPIVLTLTLLQYIYRLADHFVVDPVYRALPLQVDRTIALFAIKALILLVIFLSLCLIGLAAEIIMLKRIFDFTESILTRVPMISQIYGTFKEIMSALRRQNRDVFRRPVLIVYPRPGSYAIGFITRSSNPGFQAATGKDLVSIFVPSPPSPATGNLVFVPREDIVELSISVDDALKLILSVGMIGQTGKPTDPPLP